MAGKGPPPKSPAIRQRQNKDLTAATLETAEPITKMPALPKGYEWHPMTRRWWRAIWRSPMAPAFIETDVYALYRIAQLVNLAHWCPGDTKLEAEIRQQEARFGLTPIDRRRLQWEVRRRSLDDAENTAAAPTRDVQAQPFEDPRRKLRAVQ